MRGKEAGVREGYVRDVYETVRSLFGELLEINRARSFWVAARSPFVCDAFSKGGFSRLSGNSCNEVPYT